MVKFIDQQDVIEIFIEVCDKLQARKAASYDN